MSELDISITFNKDEKPLDFNRIKVPLAHKEQMYEVLVGVCELEMELLKVKTIEADNHVEWQFDCSKEKEEKVKGVIKILFESLMNSESHKKN